MPEASRAVALYDDRCSLCTLFAQFVKSLTKMELVGHYSPQGASLRKSRLESDALEMFWIIDKNTAYGGRAAIWPLLKMSIKRQQKKTRVDDAKSLNTGATAPKESCQISDCSGVKHVFIRSASLIRNSKVIHVNRTHNQ